MPRTREVLDLTLPYIEDGELETMIDQRAAALVRQLDAERAQANTGGAGGGGGGGGGGGRGQISVQFFEKKRRKAWYAMRGDEEICWECWTVKVTVAEPRTESGTCCNVVTFRQAATCQRRERESETDMKVAMQSEPKFERRWSRRS